MSNHLPGGTSVKRQLHPVTCTPRQKMAGEGWGCNGNQSARAEEWTASPGSLAEWTVGQKSLGSTRRQPCCPGGWAADRRGVPSPVTPFFTSTDGIQHQQPNGEGRASREAAAVSQYSSPSMEDVTGSLCSTSAEEENRDL